MRDATSMPRTVASSFASLPPRWIFRRSPHKGTAPIMRTQYDTAASLDSFIATPGDALEWMFPLGDLDEAGYPRFFQDVSAEAMPDFQGVEEITGRGC